MLKVLVTGGTGMLGTALKKYLPEADYVNGRKDLDLSYPEIWDVMQFMKFYDVIIHTAAITNLPLCEEYSPQAYHLHADAVKLLQRKCNKLIYISAQGREYDNVYFKSKLEGEKRTLEREGDVVIRVNIYGEGGLVKWATDELKEGNKIHGYDNVVFNPVHVDQLSEFISKHGLTTRGLVSVLSDETISKYEFLNLMADKRGLDRTLISPLSVDSNLDLTINVDSDLKYYSLNEGINLL